MLHIAQLSELRIKWVRFDGMKEWGRKKMETVRCRPL